MALRIYDTLVPQGDYPAVKAEDVQMPDGKKLSELEIPEIPGPITDYVKTVNGKAPDANGNVEIEVSGGNACQCNLVSPDGSRWSIVVDNAGNVSAVKMSGGNTGGEEGGETPDVPDVPDEPEKTLVSISATYSGGSVLAGTPVKNLTGVVVTAHYSDNTSEAVNGYALSGTIAEGNNTITVSYGGKTTSFIVVGTAVSVSTYTVTSALFHVASTNESAVVNEGTRYTAALSAEDGYELGSVIVTMGGVDITTEVYADGVINIAAVTGDVLITAYAAAIPTDIMSRFKYLGPTTYSPGTYTAWCPTGLIYDETRDVYAHFMNVQNKHWQTPNACELWFNTIDPETLEHTKPVFIARTGEKTSGTMASYGALGCCIKNGVYYMFSDNSRGYYKSTDGGKTWTHETYETGPDANVWGCYVLSNGRMIMGSDTLNHKVYYSDDDGKNWTTVQCENFNEPTFVDFGNGTLMALCRENYNADTKEIYPPWMHVSHDYGESWSQSVAMTSVPYMGSNNCNAYVHDNYVELFVGSRLHDTSPQYEGVLYSVKQYVLDLNKGPVDEFEFVNTVYEFSNENNPQGLISSFDFSMDFSTPCIAIKNKSHALMTFYAPSQFGVTHHMIAVGNVPVDDMEIPSIIPENYNATQAFNGTSADAMVTVCDSYGIGTRKWGGKVYPTINAGYLKLDDIEDGGFVHIQLASYGQEGAGNIRYRVPPFVSVKNGKVLSASRSPGLGASPVPSGITEVKYTSTYGDKAVIPDGGLLDMYGLFDNGYWWIYCDGTWFYINSGNVDLNTAATAVDANKPHEYAFVSEGLTGYITFGPVEFEFSRLVKIEYDKAGV